MATIQLTDGTTTLNLFDTSSYNLIDESWSPAVATRRQDSLGGSPYSDVVETLALRIKGTSTADCLDKLHNLTVLLDQADRWRMGESVAAVLFKYKPTGSAANVLSAAVLGTPAGQAAVIVPGRVEWIEGNSFQLFPVIVTFLRRGAWLDNEESDASSSVANPGIMTATNTATDLPSPVKLTLSNYTGQIWGGSFLLVTDDADKLDIFDITAATATGFTAVNDSGANPLQGTNILRYTPTDTDWHYSGNVNVDAKLLSTTRKIAVYGSFRRNAVGVTAQAKVKFLPYLTSGYNSIGAVETTPVILEEIHEQWYYLGSVTLPIDISVADEMRLSVALKTSAATSSVDINAIALMDTSTEASRAIFLPNNDTWGLVTTLTIDHRLLTKTSPIVSVDGTYQYAIPAEGGIVISTSAAEVAALWLSSGRSAVAAYYWCAVNRATTAQLSNVLTAIRRPAYLVPQ